MIEKIFSNFIFNTSFISKIRAWSSHDESFARHKEKNISDIGAFDIAFVINKTIYDHMASTHTHTHFRPDKPEVVHDIGMTCCGGKYSPLGISQLHHVEQITTIKHAESDWLMRSPLIRVT